MTCEQLEELAAAYVLDALTPDEQREVEEHLAQCPRCTQLVNELRPVVSLLPLSVPQVQPSAELKERVMAAIRQESQGTASSSPTITRQSTPRITPLPSTNPAFRPAQRKARSRWTPRILVAAAILLFILLGGLTAWNVSLTHQVASLQNQLTQVPTQQASTYTVSGTKYAQGASGQLVYYPKQNITVLTIHNLPQLTGQHIYQGWLLQVQDQKIENVMSIGVMNVHNGTATLAFAGNITGYNTTGISLEGGPTATPNAPKGNVVALGSLTTTT